MSSHKHRKGFREDQVVLSEAYGSIYNESDFAAGLENPSYGTNYIQQAIKADQIKVEEIAGIDPNENRQVDAYISKAYIQEGDNWRELTDDEYDYINDNEFDFIDTVVQAELPWGREDAESIGGAMPWAQPDPLFSKDPHPFGTSTLAGTEPPGLLKPGQEPQYTGPTGPHIDPEAFRAADTPSGRELAPELVNPGMEGRHETESKPDTAKQTIWDKLADAGGHKSSPEEYKRAAKVAGGIAGAGALAGGLVGHAMGKRKKKDDDEDEDQETQLKSGASSKSYTPGTEQQQMKQLKPRDFGDEMLHQTSKKTGLTPNEIKARLKAGGHGAMAGGALGLGVGALGASLVGRALSKRKKKDDDEKEEDFEDAEGELSDDWTQPNYKGDQHDFQPGEIVEVGPWGENDEYDHLEVVLQIKGDVINTIPITDDAYGVQYGGRGGYDISLIRPQSEIDYDYGDFKPADGREW